MNTHIKGPRPCVFYFISPGRERARKRKNWPHNTDVSMGWLRLVGSLKL